MIVIDDKEVEQKIPVLFRFLSMGRPRANSMDCTVYPCQRKNKATDIDSSSEIILQEEKEDH